jgi:hypothetical protein
MWVRWVTDIEEGTYGVWHHVAASLTIYATCGELLPSVLQERSFDFTSESVVCQDCKKKLEAKNGT